MTRSQEDDLLWSMDLEDLRLDVLEDNLGFDDEMECLDDELDLLEDVVVADVDEKAASILQTICSKINVNYTDFNLQRIIALYVHKQQSHRDFVMWNLCAACVYVHVMQYKLPIVVQNIVDVSVHITKMRLFRIGKTMLEKEIPNHGMMDTEHMVAFVCDILKGYGVRMSTSMVMEGIQKTRDEYPTTSSSNTVVISALRIWQTQKSQIADRDVLYRACETMRIPRSSWILDMCGII